MAGAGAKGITPRQENAIVALMKENTLAAAASLAEVGQRTLYRWLRQPAFAACYRDARREAFGQAIAMTQRCAPAAVATLTQVMADAGAPAATRVQAATTLLRFGRQGVALDDLASRIEALEEDPA